MKVYIAGPMTGMPNSNYDEFDKAATVWRDAGHEVTSPAENFAGRKDLDWSEYLCKAVTQVAGVDVVAVLPGWEESRGAKLEVHVAKELGKEIYNALTLLPLESRNDKEVVLDTAKDLVYGDKQSDYGHPYWDHSCTAALWATYLSRTSATVVKIRPQDVGFMMVLLKVSREAGKHKQDNLVDAAGYIETANRVLQFLEENDMELE